MIAVELGVVIALILLNGFFAMSELAVVSSRRAVLRRMADEGTSGARTALELHAEPTRFLATVQIGITLVGILAGAFGGATLAGHLTRWLAGLGMPAGLAGGAGFGLVVLGIGYLSLVLGELVPKRLALAEPERIARRVARPMRRLGRLGRPLVWLMQGSTEAVLRLLGVRLGGRRRISEEELRALLAEGAEAGVLHAREHGLLEGVMRTADRSARAIMTPRLEVRWLDADASAERVAEVIAASGHSRYPLARGRLDELIGIVEAKHLTAGLLRGEPLDLVATAYPPLVVPEGTPILRLLERFRETGRHLAVVVDEYGAIEGVVTPHDILTSIAGALPEGRAIDLPEAVRRDDGSWLIDGRMGIHEVERVLGAAGMAAGEDYTTLAGFVLWQLGRLPRVADSFVWRGWRFEVVDLDGRRIDKLLVAPIATAGEGGAAPTGEPGRP